MNLLLFSAADRISDDSICVKDRRLHHLNNVLRSNTGDRIRVGELGGRIGEGEIRSLDDSSAVLRVQLSETPPPKLPLILVLALPRPKMLRRILRTTAEMGVAELHLIHSYRVEKSYWQTPALSETAVTGYLLEGLAQARDTVLPRVLQHRRFKPFVEDELPALGSRRRMTLLHPGQNPSFAPGNGQACLVVIGPEGGFIPYEVEHLRAAGCELASLGDRILRVESAVTAMLGRFAA